MWNPTEMRFKKSGAEVKTAIHDRMSDLERRLKKRYATLDKFIADKDRMRSYLVREKDNDYPHSAQAKRDMPTEEHEEISELCRRICSVEKELNQLKLARAHLRDDQEVELSFEELTFYGFDSE
jgi:hypothetical protein